MSHHRLARLGNPEVGQVPVPIRDWIAADRDDVVEGLREQADLLAAANAPSLQTSIVMLRHVADLVAQGADVYRSRWYR